LIDSVPSIQKFRLNLILLKCKFAAFCMTQLNNIGIDQKMIFGTTPIPFSSHYKPGWHFVADHRQHNQTHQEATP
jgi:hypothetical protein